jgi:hypothetical protein
LSVTAPTATISADVALSGTGGSAAAISILPGVVDFPTVGVGHASAAVTVTLTDLGGAGELKNLVLKAPAGFKLVANHCSSTLASHASCTAGIEFVPASAGMQQADLTVTAEGIRPVDLPLQGTGFDFTVAPKGGASQTVASGQSANYSLSIAPLAGSAATFTFSCGKLPANSACIFNPASETVSAYGTGFVSVQVMTGQGSAAQQSLLVFRRGCSIALGALLLPLALRRGRRGAVFVLLLVDLGLGVTGCLSASGALGTGQNPSAPGTTPANTYTIPVTVTADGVEHSVLLTLSVD